MEARGPANQPDPAPTGERPAAAAPTGERPAAGPAALDDRIAGLRAWVAQLDRRLGVRSYAGAAALVLALATAIVALVLVLGLQEESASDAELERIREELPALEESATQAAEKEVAGVRERVDELEGQVQSLRSDKTAAEREISVLQDDVADLRDQISQLQSSRQDDDNP